MSQRPEPWRTQSSWPGTTTSIGVSRPELGREFILSKMPAMTELLRSRNVAAGCRVRLSALRALRA
eukprot:8587125-Lingulodinium_polyedra.AAC.1